MSFSGTKWKVVIPGWNREVDFTFADKGSGVTIQVMGAANPVDGIWAIDDSSTTLVVQSPSGYGWWNSVYTFKMNGNSGTGNYMGYESPIGLAYLKSCSITQTS